MFVLSQSTAEPMYRINVMNCQHYLNLDRNLAEKVWGYWYKLFLRIGPNNIQQKTK